MRFSWADLLPLLLLFANAAWADAPARTAHWEAHCRNGADAFVVRYLSPSGEWDEDDMRVEIVSGNRPPVQVPLPHAAYEPVALPAEGGNRCDRIGGFDAGEGRMLLVFSSNGRPTWSWLSLLLYEPHSGRLLDARARIAEIKETGKKGEGLAVRPGGQGFEVRLIGGSHGRSDGPEDFIEEWMPIAVRDGRIQAKWQPVAAEPISPAGPLLLTHPACLLDERLRRLSTPAPVPAECFMLGGGSSLCHCRSGAKETTLVLREGSRELCTRRLQIAAKLDERDALSATRADLDGDGQPELVLGHLIALPSAEVPHARWQITVLSGKEFCAAPVTFTSAARPELLREGDRMQLLASVPAAPDPNSEPALFGLPLRYAAGTLLPSPGPVYGPFGLDEVRFHTESPGRPDWATAQREGLFSRPMRQKPVTGRVTSVEPDGDEFKVTFTSDEGAPRILRYLPAEASARPEPILHAWGIGQPDSTPRRLPPGYVPAQWSQFTGKRARLVLYAGEGGGEFRLLETIE